MGVSSCELRVVPAEPADLETVRAAYAHGRTLQLRAGPLCWSEFDDSRILDEMARECLWRVTDAGRTAGVFSVAYEDAAIWGERERGMHVYVHRIARSPEWNSRGLIEAIFAWADDRCLDLGRSGLRLDTWASSTRLSALYERLGFEVVETRRLEADARLGPHYHGNEFALMERALGEGVNAAVDTH